MRTYMLDKEFLKNLDLYRNKEIFAKIISLDFEENPLETIEGKVTGGSINIDGTSSVRRSCSLTLVAKEVNINDFYWGLTNKFKLEIGLKNKIDSRYPDIIWFKQGTYLITSFKTSAGTNNYTISISGKDKMCLLNGDIGGNLPSSVDFGKIEDTEFVYKEKIFTEDNYTNYVADKYYIKDAKGDYVLSKAACDYRPNYYILKDYDTYKTVSEAHTREKKYYVRKYNDEKREREYIRIIDEEIYKAEFDLIVAGLKASTEEKPYEEDDAYQTFINAVRDNLDSKDVIDKAKAEHQKFTLKPNLYYVLKAKTKTDDPDVYEPAALEYDPKKTYYIIKTSSLDEEKYVKDSDPDYFNQDGVLIKPYASSRIYYVLDKAERYIKTEDVENTSETYYTKVGKEYKKVTDGIKKGTIYYEKDAVVTLTDLSLKSIIREAVHTWAQEPYSNIIINDLDEYGLELLEYRGDEEHPLYILYDIAKGTFINYTIDGKTTCVIDGVTRTLDSLSDKELDNLVDDFNKDAVEVTFPDSQDPDYKYRIVKITCGTVAGYRITDLTYNGELVSSIGETLVSMLDKIKSMLGDFSYYYDLDGRFVFERNKTYVNSSWNNIIDTVDDRYVESAAYTSAVSYSFEDSNLITAFQNSPQLNNLKNDYSVWGERKTSSDKKVPIHARFAIDKKPTYYKNLAGEEFVAEDLEWVFKNGEVLPGKTEEIIRREIKNQLVLEKQQSLKKYQKKKNPNGLPEEWWDVIDWAKYYETIAGKKPDGLLGEYANNGFKDMGVPRINLEKYFKEPVGEKYSTYAVDNWDVYKSKKVYIFDVIYAADGEIVIGSTVHETDCQHPYSYFLNIANSGWGTSFIYNPKIPEREFIENIEVLVDEKLLLDKYTFKKIKKNCDWREIIYQMAVDYYQYYDIMDGDTPEEIEQSDNFLHDIRVNNGKNVDGDYFYPTGKTGYEQYYVDMMGFWRQLYNPNPEIKFKTTGGKYVEEKVPDNKEKGTYIRQTVWKPLEEDVTEIICDFFLPTNHELTKNLSKEKKDLYCSDDAAYWNRNVKEAPELLNFWIDFLDKAGELEQFSVKAVGDRTKVINDSDVSSIYVRNTPDVIFVNEDDWMNITQYKEEKTGYNFVHATNDLNNLFVMSGCGKSAKNRIDELLYENSYCIENVTVTALPVYYLEPNTRIFIHDERSNINGEYIMTKYTLPLTYNGTMSITATKAAERLY